MGKPLENPWENDGLVGFIVISWNFRVIEWDMKGIYPLENHGKMGKPWENYRKMVVLWDLMGFTRPGNDSHSELERSTMLLMGISTISMFDITRVYQPQTKC